MRLVIKNVRVSFINALWTPKGIANVPDSPVRYSCNFIIPKDHPQVEEIKRAQEIVAKEKWGTNAAKILRSCLADRGKHVLRDGDSVTYDGYEGNYYISANARVPQKPAVRDRDGKTEIAEEDGKLYSGCYVNAHIDIYATDKGGSKLCCGLVAVQFVKRGEPLGNGGTRVKDSDFEVIQDEEEEEELDDVAF